MVLVSYKPINTIVLVGLIVMVRHFLQAGRKYATLPGTEESMTTTIEFITALFCPLNFLSPGSSAMRPLSWVPFRGSPSKVLMFLVTLSLPEGDRASFTEGQRWRCR